MVLALLTGTAFADLQGKVVRVLDGNTIEILQDSHERTRISLAGIDAPEKSQPFGQRSRQFLTSLVAQLHVRTMGDERDRYGRVPRTVWLRWNPGSGEKCRKHRNEAQRLICPSFSVGQEGRKRTACIYFLCTGSAFQHNASETCLTPLARHVVRAGLFCAVRSPALKGLPTDPLQRNGMTGFCTRVICR